MTKLIILILLLQYILLIFVIDYGDGTYHDDEPKHMTSIKFSKKSPSEPSKERRSFLDQLLPRHKRSKLRKSQRKRIEPCIGNCKRTNFYVNFTDIGWEKWILYPRFYNAYTCDGECSIPLAIRRNDNPASIDAQVTNHAQIMSILEYRHLAGKRKITKCVPTKLKPLEIVYLNDQNKLEVRVYDNMIVQQCGCR